MAKRLLFNNDWEFTKQEIGCDIHRVTKDCWQKVDIPHDWQIYDATRFYETAEGWYRKYFEIDMGHSKEQQELAQAAACYFLQFDGIYMDSTIYLNGIKVGEWKYGYSTFECDITDALISGVNEVLVQVIMQTPNSRWYSGAGIYRNVWLKEVPKLHIASHGIYIATIEEEDEWKVRIHCEVIEEGREEVEPTDLHIKYPYHLRHTLYDSKGEEVLSVKAKDDIHTLSLKTPQLWDIEEANLYLLKTELFIDDTLLEEEVNSFGFRSLRFDCDNGFYLNHRQVKLHGVCLHHDLGALGAAVNKKALERQLTLLREMGVNAIRTAHNMCAVELLELADKMGFLVVNEAFDMWEKPKTPYDYARFFPDWAEQDVANWIRRDRNHPCNIMWSIGNEIYDTHVGERGEEITRFLMKEVHLHDPLHNAYVTIGSNFMPWENARRCADILKLAGYNYGEKYYDTHHEQYKDWVIYGSETGAVVQSRGIYHFPLEADILCDDDEQCSSLGNSTTSWGAKTIEKCITDDRDAKYSPGMFIWSGFDYIGEPTPYHTKNSYFGQLDTAGFKKDAFYIYQAEWTDYKISPMVHLFPYWDFNEGQLIDVRVCSNAPKVELFFNNVSCGTYDIDHEKGYKLLGDWKLPYRQGELRALAYDEHGKIIAEDIQRSFLNPVSIRLKPDKTTMMADGEDLIFLEISMEDEAGNPVHNANNRVYVKVTGAGRLIGLDNGDSTDYDSYKGVSRRLFSGKLLAIIAAKTNPGEIKVEVSSLGLPTAFMTFTAKEANVCCGISAFAENIGSENNQEVPIRKLEIISPMGTYLNEKLQEVEVEVKIHPTNATYEDISWRVTNAAGVDSNIVKLSPRGRKAILRAVGDGSFYVRAMANNGRNKPSLISALDYKITGLGMAYFNPYEFMSGSLYSRSRGEISSGNERGVASSRDGESILCYDKLDFGEIGSDEITLPIFELESRPTQIEIWEGMPGEAGSRLLADVIYEKKSIWNTYQEETFQLNRRLKGVTSIAFVLRHKAHIKGFTFKKPEKAYERLYSNSYNLLYGDDFKEGPEAITDIGNNVTIAFQDMDFGNHGIKKLLLCGRCSIHNSIVVCFKGEGTNTRQIVEFPKTQEYTEVEFVLNNVLGLQTVEFLFLPGCKFDFKWFQFVK